MMRDRLAATSATATYEQAQAGARTGMTPARFQEIRGLFEAALRIDPDQRPGWLREACKGDTELYLRVEELLLADRLVGEGVVTISLTVAKDETALPNIEGRQFGHYQLIREVGRGGMGTVYLARRTDDVFSKEVALKLLRPERSYPELLRRFRQERDIVARLDHPNIARLLDGGTTEEGALYSVMEYVEGQPIDIYCDAHRLNTSERLKLFRTVCAAVQYAHQNLVVHRDLKPSNILVTTNGTVKLLDFGIAKLIEGDPQETFTDAGHRPMTPAYASPEQTRGEAINTSSDVYSLGVVLYELLTGRWPYGTRGRLHEVAQAICEREAVRPSETVLQRAEDSGVSDTTAEQLSDRREGKPAKLQRRLAGELDNILLMALRKEPRRRYSSVEQFSEDLNRHLSGLPILAQHDTLHYRTGKFVKRHRAGVVAAALVGLMMCTGVVVTSWEARVARQERASAQQQAAEAKFQSARAEREAANAKEQLRIAEERDMEVKAKSREANLEREKAARRAQQAYSVSQELLKMNELNIDSPDVAGQNSRQALAKQIVNELLREGFKARPLSRPINLGFETTK
jgi:serine/threonine protein kinase